MTYDFDRLIDRRRTDSSKWQKYGPDVLPLWVADMDFQSPESVIRALRLRVEHGVFGYLAFEQPEFHELFADRLLKRYNYAVAASVAAAAAVKTSEGATGEAAPQTPRRRRASPSTPPDRPDGGDRPSSGRRGRSSP